MSELIAVNWLGNSCALAEPQLMIIALCSCRAWRLVAKCFVPLVQNVRVCHACRALSVNSFYCLRQSMISAALCAKFGLREARSLFHLTRRSSRSRGNCPEIPSWFGEWPALLEITPFLSANQTAKNGQMVTAQPEVRQPGFRTFERQCRLYWLTNAISSGERCRNDASPNEDDLFSARGLEREHKRG